jgi:hypothetical protein
MRDREQAKSWLARLLASVGPALDRGEKLEVLVKPAKRNSDQNAKLHAEIGEIARTMEWAGKKREADTWKRLLVAAWLRARGESVEILPALDGHGIDVVWRRTSTLTKAECAELIDYITCWKAEHMEICKWQ